MTSICIKDKRNMVLHQPKGYKHFVHSQRADLVYGTGNAKNKRNSFT